MNFSTEYGPGWATRNSIICLNMNIYFANHLTLIFLVLMRGEPIFCMYSNPSLLPSFRVNKIISQQVGKLKVSRTAFKSALEGTQGNASAIQADLSKV